MNLEEIGIPFTDLGEDKEVGLLWNISQSLVSTSYLKEILQLIVTMTANALDIKTCSLMLFDESKGELAIAATQALSKDYISKPNLKVGESLSGRALIEKKPIQVKDVQKDVTYGFPEIAKKEGFISMLSVPMIIEDRAIGVINVYSTEAREFTDNNIKTLQAVANQAAIAVENTKLRQENLEARHLLEEKKTVDRAKALLMEKDGMSEADADNLLQSASRDQRVSLVAVANAIILAYPLRQK